DVEHDGARGIRVRFRIDVEVLREGAGPVVDENMPLLSAEARRDPFEVAVTIEIAEDGADFRAARRVDSRRPECAVAVSEQNGGTAAAAVHCGDVELAVAVHVAENEFPHGAASALRCLR